jgi:heat shock transcription factor
VPPTVALLSINIPASVEPSYIATSLFHVASESLACSHLSSSSTYLRLKMTTPPQPSAQNGRSRKRPAPGTSAPVVSSLPATAGSAATATDMGYYNSVPAGTAGGPSGSIYVSDGTPMSVPTTSQPDMYRQQPTQGPQPGLYSPAGPDTQLTRVPRANQLIRMPSFNGMNPPGIPQSLVPGNQLPINLNMMQGMMGQSGAFDQVTGMDATDRDLFSRIEKMKKKRANIPPFVLKLSRYERPTTRLCSWRGVR